MQLEYNREPAVAVQGMMAEPMAPFRNVSRIAEEDIEFGLAVKAGTDPTTQAEVCAAPADFIGFAVMSDNREMQKTGVVTSLATAQAGRQAYGEGETSKVALGEVYASATIEQFEQFAVMQEGTIFVPSGAALSGGVGDELEIDAAGKVVDIADAAVSTGARYKIFIVEKTDAVGSADVLVKVRVSGPQGA